MVELNQIILVWLGTVTVTFLAWIIVHFNGRVLCSYFDLINFSFSSNHKVTITKKSWLSVATEVEIIILGIIPVAIASLVSTADGNCYNSINSFLITEVVIISLFLLIPRSYKSYGNFCGEQLYKPYRAVFAIAIIWCLVFAIWSESAIDPQTYLGAERLVINKNADMWYYVRRYAAYTLNNLSFSNQPACSYLQLSPKKLSSFIGSIIVYLTPNTVLGITWFQGLLGCSLFLSLFGNWYSFSYGNKSISTWGTVGAIIWAIFSPPIFWLINSSYLSNALFITIFVLSITAARRLTLHHLRYPNYAKYIILFGFIINIFSFYLVILPVALSCYLVTITVYASKKYLGTKITLINFSKNILAAGLSILLCVILFNHQINLAEVSNNLNALQEHGQNFAPLNPWSLIQEKPNPMPNIKDIGLWLNVIIGIIFTVFVLQKISSNWHQTKHQTPTTSSYPQDLIAAVLVLLFYLLYLLAYIPLEYTYRLGKLAISIIYPLTIFSILPTILWFRDRYYRQKSRTFQVICLTIVAVHIILHIEKTMSPKALPLGTYNIISNKSTTVANLTIIGCEKNSLSQKYERLVGLDLAKKYPDLKIDVVAHSEANSKLLFPNSLAKGIDINHNQENLCLFEINL